MRRSVRNDCWLTPAGSCGGAEAFLWYHEAAEIVGFSDYKNVAAWLERGLARPAVQKGLNIPPLP